MAAAEEPILAGDIGGGFRPTRASSVVFAELDGETVLHDEATGATHLLNQSATVLWDCFDGGATVDELAAEVAAAYELDPDLAATQVLGVVRALGALGVIDGVQRTASTPERSEAASANQEDDCA